MRCFAENGIEPAHAAAIKKVKGGVGLATRVRAALRASVSAPDSLPRPLQRRRRFPG